MLRIPMPKPVLPTTQSKGQRSSDNFSDGKYLYKFPRLDNINTLIDEFFTTRLAAKIVEVTNFNVLIPEISVEFVKEKLGLKISWIPDYTSLKKLAAKFSEANYENELLQCLVIDLLVGNIDGHKKNLGLNSENKLSHIDFDRSFKMNLGKTIEQNIEEIADAIKDGFAQQTLIKGSNINRLKDLVKAVLRIDGIEQIMMDCLNKAAEELKKIPEIAGVDIDLRLATAQTYMERQLKKFAEFEHSTAKAPLIPPPAPCKPRQEREEPSSKAKRLYFGEDTHPVPVAQSSRFFQDHDFQDIVPITKRDSPAKDSPAKRMRVTDTNENSNPLSNWTPR